MSSLITGLVIPAKSLTGKICLEQILAALAACKVQYMDVLHPILSTGQNSLSGSPN